MNRISSWNNTIAVRLTLIMSTMWCVYGFFLWSILPLIAPQLEQVCMYVSSTVVQLVSLPLIMVGQNLLGKNTEQRAEQDHTSLMEAVADLQKIMTEEDESVSVLADINRRLAAIEAALPR